MTMGTKEAEGESRTGPNWLELPLDVTANILERLGVIEIVTCVCKVCSLWWNMCKDPLMWRTIDMSNLRYSPYNLVKICRYLVKLSCGHLEAINIESFGDEHLLHYIADSTSHLRRMRLVNCQKIFDEDFINIAKKLPQLEELDILYCNLGEDSLEAIGRCCPLLKSLKYCYIDFSEEDDPNDDEVFVIAKTMPQLRHLQIYGNMLSNDGLLAILDGCPLLESLDLRECDFLNWSGSLGKRCVEQIQHLRPPTDSDSESFLVGESIIQDLHDRFYWDLGDRHFYDSDSDCEDLT